MPVLFDFLRGSVHIDLVAARQHDSVTTMANLEMPKQSVVIEDLGYLDDARMQNRLMNQVYTVVPCKRALAFFAADTEHRIDLAK